MECGHKVKRGFRDVEEERRRRRTKEQARRED